MDTHGIHFQMGMIEKIKKNDEVIDLLSIAAVRPIFAFTIAIMAISTSS